MMKFFIILNTISIALLLLVLPAKSKGLNLDGGILETLEEYLDTQVNENVLAQSKAVGLGLSVISGNGSILYSKGFGFRDVELNSLATGQSLFGVGSVTKSFTATLVIKILNEMFPQFGENVLDIPVNSLVESVNLTLSDRYRTETVSFRDLLSHRLCVTAHIMGITFGAIDDAQDFIHRSRYESQVCPFRANFFYNTVMIAVAADLISKIKGDSFDNLMREFLDELGMTDSRLYNHQVDYQTLDNLMQSYYIDGEQILRKADPNLVREIASAAAAGGLLSTADDMTKYISFHLNHGRSIGGQQVVPSEVMEWMYKVSMTVDHTSGYGLCFFLNYIGAGEEPLIYHGGYVAPFSSLLTIHRGLDVGIFISTNGPGSATPQKVQNEFTSQILQFISQANGKKDENLVNFKPKNIDLDQSVSFKPFLGNKEMKAKAGTGTGIRATCTVNDIVGVFGHALEGEMEFMMDSETGEATIKYGRWGVGKLIQIEMEECKFNMEIIGDGALHLYSGMDGGIIVNTAEFQLSESGGWDILIWEIGLGELLTFRRNFTVWDLPEIPYDPNSCVAENIYT